MSGCVSERVAKYVSKSRPKTYSADAADAAK